MHRFAILAATLNAGIAIAAPITKLWQPSAGTPWHITLTQKIDLATCPDVPVYDIDLFDTDAATIAALQAKGKIVVCYFSAGSTESWRPDASKFQPSDLGNGLEGWAGEKWLDVKSANVRSIMSARIDLAAQKGCNAIDPDNVDGYDNNNGLSLTQDDAANYVNWIAGVAAAKGIATGLKNAGSIISKVMDNVHFSVNEQCHAMSECQTYQPFITANKPVFNIEYPPEAGTSSYSTSTCAGYGGGSTGFSTVVKKMDLDAWTQLCPISGASYVPQTVTPPNPAAAGSAPAASNQPSPTTASPAQPSTSNAASDNDNEPTDTTPAPADTTPVPSPTDAAEPTPTDDSSSETHHSRHGNHGKKSNKHRHHAQDDDTDDDNDDESQQ